MDFNQRVAVPDSVLFRELDGEAVLLDLETEAYFGLDSMGTAIWQQLAAQPTIEAAVVVLLDEYDVEPARLRADVTEFVGQLVEHGLLEVA